MATTSLQVRTCPHTVDPLASTGTTSTACSWARHRTPTRTRMIRSEGTPGLAGGSCHFRSPISCTKRDCSTISRASPPKTRVRRTMQCTNTRIVGSTRLVLVGRLAKPREIKARACKLGTNLPLTLDSTTTRTVNTRSSTGMCMKRVQRVCTRSVCAVRIQCTGSQTGTTRSKLTRSRQEEPRKFSTCTNP